MKAQAESVRGEARHVPFLQLYAPLLIALAGVAAYSDSFSGPFVYDDLGSIPENQTIRHLAHLGAVLSPPQGVTVTGRPILNLSLAINRAISGNGVWSYHAANLIIHLLAGLTLFGIARRTLSLARFPQDGRLSRSGAAAATPIALAIALLWTLHPLQTEAVTYIVQRAESLMGLFYLLTLYCSLRGMNSPAPARWYILAIGACLAGMATKEVMVSAPVIVFLYDRTFVAGSFRGAWKNRKPLYIGLAGTWVLLAYLVVGAGGNRNGAFSLGIAASWWAHGLTQFQAVARYLWLSIWPHPLVFEYGEFWVTRAADIVPYAPVVIVLLVFTGVGLKRWPIVGFLGAWFFLILAPTCLLPGTSEMIVEHRMYLALAPVLAAIVFAGFALVPKPGVWLAALASLAAAFGALTFHRNQVYRSDLALWEDTVAMRPGNALAHNNLGAALEAVPGRIDEAVAEHQEAIRLKPAFVEAHNNLGNDWLKIPGRANDAVGEFEEALRLNPGYAKAHNNLGIVWAETPGRLDAAAAEFGEAIRSNPNYAEAHNNLGIVLTRLPGKMDDAVLQFQEALQLDPDYPEAHCNLGNAWFGMPGRMNDAVGQYREAIRLNPGYVDAHLNLATALLQMPGQAAEARSQLEEALRLQPGNGAARQMLAGLEQSNQE